MKTILSFLLIAFIFISCNKEKKYSNIPKITFNSLSHQKLIEGSGDSILKIYFDFEDGDGNIGFGTNNLFLAESRTPSDTVAYMIPKIPIKFYPENGLKGIIQVDIQGGFLLCRTDTLHKETDTLHWTIYMKDQAGNRSNYINTSDLILTK